MKLLEKNKESDSEESNDEEDEEVEKEQKEEILEEAMVIATENDVESIFVIEDDKATFTSDNENKVKISSTICIRRNIEI